MTQTSTIALLVFLFLACTDNSNRSLNSNETPSADYFTGHIIAYTLSYEAPTKPTRFKNEIRLIENGTEYKLFPNDTSSRGYPSISPDGSKILYIKNFAMYIWGYSSGLSPQIFISRDKGNTEQRFITDTSSKYYFPHWHTNDTIVISRKAPDSSYYITFFDTLGNILDEIKSPHPWFYISHSSSLICFTEVGVGLVDLPTMRLRVLADTLSVAGFYPPSFRDSTLLVPLYTPFVVAADTFNNILYNSRLGSYTFLSWPPSSRLLFWNNKNLVGTTNDNAYLVLYDSTQTPIDSINYPGSSSIGIEFTTTYFKDSLFYYAGDLPGSNDAFNIFQADFKNRKIAKLTNNPSDHVIQDFKVYDIP